MLVARSMLNAALAAERARAEELACNSCGYWRSRALAAERQLAVVGIRRDSAPRQRVRSRSVLGVVIGLEPHSNHMTHAQQKHNTITSQLQLNCLVSIPQNCNFDIIEYKLVSVNVNDN